MNLEEFLVEYDEKDIYPMHMPGHKRNTTMMKLVNPYKIDVTEAGELDNMHNPEGVIKEAIERCREGFGAERSFFLINGSTCGLLAAISAAVKRGGRVLMSRACHKAVYNGVFLRGASAEYIYPEMDESFGIYGSISPESVEEKLAKGEIADLVVITSPTYEGVVSDIKGIAEICHRYGVPLLVDGAHGAHFGFHDGLPERAIKLGADMVVESIHKTLPAMTQTSLLHVSSELVDIRLLEQYLTTYQTTSPSYILMSGIDRCCEFVFSERGRKAFDKYIERLKAFDERMKSLKRLRVLCKGEDDKATHPGFYDFDPGKIVISVRGTGLTGTGLEEILRDKYSIQLEMALGDYAIAMTSICDTEAGFERLAKALEEIDGSIGTPEICGDCAIKSVCSGSPYSAISGGFCEQAAANEERMRTLLMMPKAGSSAMSSQDAVESEGELCDTDKCEGRISREYIYAYPPGIPVVVPGERITSESLDYIGALHLKDTAIYSSLGSWPESISVVKGGQGGLFRKNR